MRRYARGVWAFLVLPLTGCAINQSALAPAGVGSTPTAAVSPARLEQLANGNTAFGLQVYQRLRGESGNVCISPYSISTALAMTYAGARGETARQMAQTLNFYLPQEQVPSAFSALNTALINQAVAANRQQEEAAVFRFANALWSKSGQTFSPTFAQTLALNYGAGVRETDFGQPEVARQAINAWAEQETGGRVSGLIGPGVLQPNTPLVLTNAIFFTGTWEKAFPAADTHPAPFLLLDGTRIETPMMRGRQRGRYGEMDGCRVAEIPYRGGQFAMIVLLPDRDRFREFEAAFTPDRLWGLLTLLRPAEFQLALPKFTSTSSSSLAQALTEMGLSDAFSAKADFSGMTGQRGLFLSAVLHKALVEVNEKGTEAAASTAVVTTKGAAPPVQQVIVDHPFIFLIRDEQTGSLLFLGRVLDPRE